MTQVTIGWLFSSQTFSRINTPTFSNLVILHTNPPMKMEQKGVPKHRRIRGGAVKSLARPTSRCRRTESTVSLERGGCSCAELQVFSSYRG